MHKYLANRAPSDGWSREQINLFVEATEDMSPELAVQAFKRVGIDWTAGWSPQPGDIRAAAAKIRADAKAFDMGDSEHRLYLPPPDANDWKTMTEAERAALDARVRPRIEALEASVPAPPPSRNFSLQALGYTTEQVDRLRRGEPLDEPEQEELTDA